MLKLAQTNRPTNRQGKNNTTIFAHLRGTNILFHDPRQNCPTPSSHVIQLTASIFELNSRIKETNVLSKFHENWAKNVTSTIFTCFHYIHRQKNAPPTGGLFFHRSRPFSNSSEISIKPMENCHYIHIEKNALPTGGHVFSPISIIFELVRDIN
ncbi:hypothetical protein DPMN_180034 [Dreissena polymorpha]|uniref:Uncharacterized protein n=1 Tax=Dreissena polymorpha TaxID=45954 RepID=A0A9D4IMV5_DREPO|nr:hypothetical protein DPMN_180034 [Dreissena polymorpha]